MQTRRRVFLAGLACSLAAAVTLQTVLMSAAQAPAGGAPPASQTPPAQPAAQTPPATPPALSPKPEGQELVALSQLVDSAASGQPAASPVAMSWVSNHFIKSQGDAVYIPFTLTVDRAALASPAVAIYVRAVSKTAAPAASPAPPAPAPPAAGAAPAQGAAAPPAPPARPTYSWDTIHVIEIPADGKLARAIMLAPGAYDVYIGVRERVAPAPGSTPAPGKMGLLRREVTVPALGGADPQTSSVILARAFEQLPAPLSAEKQEENPYVFGTLKLVPSLDHVFSKTGNLTVMFWIYNVSQTAGKPDVVVDFSFSQKQPDGSFKYINRTKPQPMNAETLPADFNLTAGHQLLSSLVIGLKSFAEGEWRIEIKVTDKMSGKLLTKEVDFQVSA